MLPQEYKISQQRVWPYPNQIEKGTEEFEVNGRLHIDHFEGLGNDLICPKVITEFNRFVFFKNAPREKGPFKVEIKTRDTLSTPSVCECYELVVNEDGIKIVANSYVGAVWGLMTLQQLIRRKKGRYVIENAPLRIVDGPSISYRSVMLDAARQFLPVPVIKRQIRAMAFNKLNILHLHITDGQSFPLKVGPYTKRIALGKYQGNTGAFSSKEVYSRSDIREIVNYARARGIIVVPEVDTPGHTASWACGFPEIMACLDGEYQTEMCCPEPPCGFLNIKEQFLRIKEVVANVWNEVIDAFSVGQEGYGSYIHIGFDEVGCANFHDGQCHAPSCENAFGPYSEQYANWLLPWIQENHPQLHTVMWVDQILVSNFKDGKFQEVIKVDPEKVWFQFWTIDANAPGQLNELAAKGFKFINSQSTFYYVDSGGQGNNFVWGGPLGTKNSDGEPKIIHQKQWMTTYPGIPAGTNPSTGWALSWEEIYLNNPTYLTTATKIKLPVAGVEICMWGEQFDPVNLDQQLWPRGAAFAESLWRFDENRPPDNHVNARYRLIFAREDMLRLGVFAAAMVPGDVFRKAPWGALDSATSLMYDINQNKQQVPEGYIFSYLRYWLANVCQQPPVNPYCGQDGVETMNCDGTGAPYIQGGCPDEGKSNS